MTIEHDAPGVMDTSALDEHDYAAEIRFGVVMYGGVSLAIYINGVANEIYELAASTPREGLSVADPPQPSTRAIYRRLSWLVGSRTMRRKYAEAIRDATASDARDWPDVWDDAWIAGAIRTRFAIDVVAGTSAGGINGLFLAKAIANGEQFGALKQMWVNEGDIGLLLNDDASSKDVNPPIPKPDPAPRSLLNSDRMYAKLYGALSGMQPVAVTADDDVTPGASPFADEIDLFITTTDVKGSPVALRLFDKVVYERRYKQSYHFNYPYGISDAAGNDFASVNTPFLAFAARCTSSFPFAFEPMTLARVTTLDLAGPAPGVRRWDGFFPNLPRAEVAAGQHVDRAFGDGGYLDNKPFTYVVDALSRRYSAVPIERKLVFVEPAPEHFDPDSPNERPAPGQQPDALDNALAALTTIPQYETIREDLQAILNRNRRVERIERVVRLGEGAIRESGTFDIKLTQDQKVPAWSTLGLTEMAAYYGTAFLPYQRLRVYAVTDLLSDRIAARLGIDPDSDQQYALRALVRVWREAHYADDPTPGKATVNAFLNEFDVEYRGRRLAFLMRKVDVLLRLARKQTVGALPSETSPPSGNLYSNLPATDDEPQPLSDEEKHMLDVLVTRYPDLATSLDSRSLRLDLAALHVLKRAFYRARKALTSAGRAIDRVSLEAPGGVAPFASAEALRDALTPLLLTILGHVTPPQKGESVERAAARAATSPEFTRMESASCTLQESVMERARQIVFLDGDAAPAATPVEDWLVRTIGSMRVRAGADDPTASPPLAAIAGLTSLLLGEPKLVPKPAAVAEAARTAQDPSLHLVQDSTQPTVEFVVNDVGAHHDADGRPIAAPDPDLVALVGGREALDVLNGSRGVELRQLLASYYLRFDSYDQISFPLYYDTGTGEPSTVEVVRVSPVDATNLIDEGNDPNNRKKLAGTALANFGAFLDKRWRLNDIMWGQLDGAERLIQALLPMSDPDTQVVRHELIERAQRAILQSALVPEGHGALSTVVLDALRDTPAAELQDTQLQALFAQLARGDGGTRARMASVIDGLFDPPGLMEFVRRSRANDPEPDPEKSLTNAARAVTITGRVMEGITKRRTGTTRTARWLARFGLMAQGVAAVLLPGSLTGRIWRHSAKLLYAFEIVLLGLAFLFGSADLRTLAVSAFATTVALHLLTLVVGDVLRERRPKILYACGVAVFIALVGFAVLGALMVVHLTSQQVLCWRHPAAVDDRSLAAKACRTVGEGQRLWTDLLRDEAPQTSANPSR